VATGPVGGAGGLADDGPDQVLDVEAAVRASAEGRGADGDRGIAGMIEREVKRAAKDRTERREIGLCPARIRCDGADQEEVVRQPRRIGDDAVGGRLEGDLTDGDVDDLVALLGQLGGG
jgi:hypothetical protein